MTAAIAAYRAGNAGHMLKFFEVETATMMAAKGAVIPVAKLMKDADEPFNPSVYLPTVSGYYTDPKSGMLSFPFNSSTVVFYVNKDAFKKAGLDPNKPPKTWKEFVAAAEKLKASGHPCAYTTSWPAWTHIENFSAWHNVPIGTRENGMAGPHTQLQSKSPLPRKNNAILGQLAQRRHFRSPGRRNRGPAKLLQRQGAKRSDGTRW